ncbi:hypothetical protein, conserved [Eimeria necatrix]|uniref:Uncharacterized protein n=1 Tax=Eimeria necatrix TaxID=51315 RepID=U6MZA6_9EIME|nr:hypothetical protein, conserved [Eimeria necatrix]CDJ69528.1 hypothetical protein, conserved [Eimeria necatrix]
MLPAQLRKAVEAANQTAQQQIKNESENKMTPEEHGRLAELQRQRAHLEMRQLQYSLFN